MNQNPRGRRQLYLLAITALMAAETAWAGPAETCHRLHNRLTGIPPLPATLEECVNLVNQGKTEEAAMKMMEHEFFYSDTLRSMFTPWSTNAQEKLGDLNDMVATAIGLVRDNVDFRELLTTDVKYVCEGVTPAYSNESNDHYKTCGQNPSLKTVLQSQKQVDLDPQLANKTAVPSGIYTTRAFANGFFNDGTNRAGIRFTFVNFLCEDMPAFQDNTIPDTRVRQDVDRAPGGQTKSYVNECKGCHAGMDGLAGAFAYLNFDGNKLAYTEPTPQNKYFRNDKTFPLGYRTKDDAWQNLWLVGQNARVGWGDNRAEGKGVRDFGSMISHSDQFNRCMAKTVYRQLCVNDLDLQSPEVKDLADKFSKSGHNMKSLFAHVAMQCVQE